MEIVKLREIDTQPVEFDIVSMTSMIQHRWSEKAKGQIRDKQAGKKTKARDKRDPNAEFKEATYKTSDGKYGIPLLSLKAAIIGAAHKDLGVEKTLVRKALFIQCPPNGGPDMVLEMKCEKPIMREDTVRVGAGSADLRYRPEFTAWSLHVKAIIDAELLQVTDLLNLVDRAGFGVGIGEWRPEKGGEYGRFQVNRAAAEVKVAAGG